ncbi:conjugal transfer pilus assembly protein TraB [Azotobacter beijerinckii]|uniref:Conjugal transfer pilus assembly protein TraB n=1 Tax=Azotobacter beijerinckii TaxID=170623 RepID=A0A1H6WVG3_9GAMM|nr:TrbI/VirB10 family protein [Azotobacter beijerinckii]SEJ16750.1 conjugal transfer pilus assembly protein TraB [Azotobacter beijerinckii]
MQNLQSLYENLTPTAKRTLAIGGTVAVVGTLVAVAMSAANPDSSARSAPSKPKVEAILTDDDPRSMGLDALVTQIQNLQKSQYRMEQAMGLREKEKQDDRTQQHVNELEKQLKELRNSLAQLERRSEPSEAGREEDAQEAGLADESYAPARRTPFVSKATNSPATLSQVYADMPAPTAVGVPGHSGSGEAAAPKIRTIRSGSNAKDAGKDKLPKAVTVSLPAGAILSGVLVTGMDAPTGSKAQKDPYPSLVRIKSEAILPNRFRADFRECFVIAAGWGERSSERAYMRAERLSCVRNDGAVLETTLDAYVTGEDGKAGIRGRLVSKQGQLLSRALLAGFAEGISSAFDVRQVPSISVTRGGDGDSGKVSSPVYEQALDANAMQGAAVRGVGSALERLADYYMDMAEEMFPVIEIDAMREVSFIVKKGLSAQFDENSLKVSSVK